MNIHKNARLTPRSRALMISRIVDEGWSVKAAAEAAGVSRRLAHKWLGRRRRGASEDFTDRSSAPPRCPRSRARLVRRGFRHSCSVAFEPRPNSAYGAHTRLDRCLWNGLSQDFARLPNLSQSVES